MAPIIHLPLITFGRLGLTSTKSQPTKFRPRHPRMSSRAWMVVSPPTSGVPGGRSREAMVECFFKCGTSNKSLTTAGLERIKTIIESSKTRSDDLHIDLQRPFDENNQMTIQCHRSCVSSYTSKSHINRDLKRQEQASTKPLYAPSPSKRIKKSEASAFSFQEHSLFCGERCEAQPNPKNPSRWRKAKVCRTADRGPDRKPYKKVILEACHKRNDRWSREVMVRLQGAMSDLHAADARYHADCRCWFLSPKSVAQAKETKPDDKLDPAFQSLIIHMESNKSSVWTSVEVHNMYQENNGSQLSRSSLVQRLAE
ncbi:hypothetical protein GWK47_048802 [Chionoecetes opilio]|uniref:Uncharacterized protein n=1 Tax=Chionoecetes opilio TaxID=41210 RepID=A0A8J4Y418_CHIOP|nr:hypothetical protein GWK47_048802 [Chionoecetes opilio]